MNEHSILVRKDNDAKFKPEGLIGKWTTIRNTVNPDEQFRVKWSGDNEYVSTQGVSFQLETNQED